MRSGHRRLCRNVAGVALGCAGFLGAWSGTALSSGPVPTVPTLPPPPTLPPITIPTPTVPKLPVPPPVPTPTVPAPRVPSLPTPTTPSVRGVDGAPDRGGAAGERVRGDFGSRDGARNRLERAGSFRRWERQGPRERRQGRNRAPRGAPGRPALDAVAGRRARRARLADAEREEAPVPRPRARRPRDHPARARRGPAVAR